MILVIDNYDSFTFNLVDYFYQLGVDTEIIRNNVPLEQIDTKRYEGIVLSPGPEKPDKAGYLMDYIRVYHMQVPILGICLGHQAIGQFFGADLIKAKEPVHGKVRKVRHQDDQLFTHIPSPFQATRYHSLVLKDLPKPLECIAESETGEIMAIKHRHLPLYGIQYHPESILTEFGLTILKNWINLLNIES